MALILEIVYIRKLLLTLLGLRLVTFRQEQNLKNTILPKLFIYIYFLMLFTSFNGVAYYVCNIFTIDKINNIFLNT